MNYLNANFAKEGDILPVKESGELYNVMDMLGNTEFWKGGLNIQDYSTISSSISTLRNKDMNPLTKDTMI